MNNQATPSIKADVIEDEIRRIQHVLGDLALELKVRFQKRISEIRKRNIIQVIMVLVFFKFFLFSGRQSDFQKKNKVLRLRIQKLTFENSLLKRQLRASFQKFSF